MVGRSSARQGGLLAWRHPRLETLAASSQAFAALGYVECAADNLESGFEKVALFANEQGLPLHAARQLPSGRWSSKLDEREDIEHGLRDLEGTRYGSVLLIMKRPLRTRMYQRDHCRQREWRWLLICHRLSVLSVAATQQSSTFPWPAVFDGFGRI